MSWLDRLCRNTGLFVHNVMHPGDQRHEVKRTVEEKKVDDTVTLRRTTIEEIEIKRNDNEQ